MATPQTDTRVQEDDSKKGGEPSHSKGMVSQFVRVCVGSRQSVPPIPSFKRRWNIPPASSNGTTSTVDGSGEPGPSMGCEVMSLSLKRVSKWFCLTHFPLVLFDR